jgi:hypothetical protein
VFYIGTFVVATLALVLVDGVVRFSRSVRWSIVGIIYANLVLSMTPYAHDELYGYRLFSIKELRLDNLMHGAAAVVATLAVCEVCLVYVGVPKARWGLAAVSALAALGLGSIKELLDILTGWVGAEELMWSTGRDLLWNTMGASAAGIVIAVIGSTHPRPNLRNGANHLSA